MSEVLQIYQKLSAGLQIEAELLFPNLTFRRGKDGPIHRVSFEITEELWTALKYLPADIRMAAPLRVLPDDETGVAEVQGETKIEKKTAKPKESKGPHGAFWREVEAKNFFSNPHLMEWIETQRRVPGSPMPEVIRAAFGVTSRAQISPDELLARLERDMPPQVMANLKVTIDRMRAKTEGGQ
jgi:hypothetical protein